MNVLDARTQSHQLRKSEDYEVVINEQGANLTTPEPVQGQAFYPGGNAPRKEYTGTVMERTGEALEDLSQATGSMAVGTAAGVAGLPGDVVSLIGGLSSALFPGDKSRMEAATETMSKISETIGSERFLGLYRDFVNNADLSQSDKQMMLDAAEIGSFLSIPGVGATAAVGKDAIKEGVVKAGQAADARIADRAADTGVTLAAGADPMPAIDKGLSAMGRAFDDAQARYFEQGKFEPPTAENPVSIVPPTETEPGIIAFHGSGADFDEFRLEMIGTGEGAQAYGYGLYFTDSEDIAKFYRDSVTDSGYYLELDGQPIDSVYTQDNIEKHALTLSNIVENDEYDDALVVLDNLGQGVPNLVDAQYLAESSLNKQQQAVFDKLVKSGFLTEADPVEGKIYKVGLAPKPDELLDYDKSLRQQPKFAEALKPLYDEYGVAETADIGTLFESIKGARGISARDLTDRLSKAGIPGIKYRAAGSRGAATADEAAERNYVIFDDKAVKILEKYGIVGPVAVTAAGASQTNTEAADGQDS